MKRLYIPIIIYLLMVLATGCEDVLNSKIDTELTDEMIAQDYEYLWDFGYSCYSEVNNGFDVLDNNLFAPVTDEAEQTSASSNAQLFNDGSWNAYNNPDNVYDDCYTGIRAVNEFLDQSSDFKTFLALNRDTISDDQISYNRNVQDIQWLRYESRVLRAYYYFELIKRYGNVPLVTKTLTISDNANLPQTDFNEVINYIVSEIDAVSGNLQSDWRIFDEARDGRITQGAALALKSRALLYAASPLHNPSNDVSKWQDAAKAAYDVIALNIYSIDPDYENLFLSSNTVTSNETIWAVRLGATNTLEKENYPIGTPGGSSGITPSQNLVSAYEYMGIPDPNDPYANRDPRLGFTVVTNNSTWNNRTIQIWSGGTDDSSLPNTSKTGYYLKKFLNPDLNLVQNESRLRNWIIFRYGEILLNYAEAMNEAYGPDNDNGYGLTARQAINAIRSRPGVNMPDIIASGQSEMRDEIKHERRIELAFEGHRYWDLMRWKDAENTLNQPLKGIRAVKNTDDSFTYSEFSVEDRIFVAPKMYYFPIPQTEISKSNGVLKQNPGW